MTLFRRAALAAGVLFALAAAAPAFAQPAARVPNEALLDTMLGAIKSGGYDTFLASASAQMKAKLTRDVFQDVTAQLAPRLGAGYRKAYLGELKQQGHRVQLWKLEFTDGQDDALVKMATKDGLVGGFWIQ